MKKILFLGLVWRGLNYFSVLILTISIARFFEAEASGTINFLLNNLAIFVLVAGFSLESATGYFGASDSIAGNKLSGLSLLCVFVVIAIAIPVTYFVLELQETSLQTGAILYAGGIMMCSLYNVLFYARHLYLLPNLVILLLNIGLSIVLWFATSLELTITVNRFLLIYGAGQFIAGVILLVGYMPIANWKLSLPCFSELKTVLHYAGICFITNFVFFLVYRIDYWFVKQFSDQADLGIYIQVSKLGQIFMLVPGIFATIVFNQTARLRDKDQLYMVQILSRVLTIGYLVCITLLLLIGGWVFPLLYGQSFNGMANIFIFLAPGILALSTLSLVTAYNAGHGKITINLTGGFIALFVIIVGNFLFTPRYGIIGAASVSSVGYIIYQVYIMYNLGRRYPGISLYNFFVPVKNDLLLLKKMIKLT